MKPPAKEAIEIEGCTWPGGHVWSTTNGRNEQECLWCFQRRVLREQPASTEADNETTNS